MNRGSESYHILHFLDRHIFYRMSYLPAHRTASHYFKRTITMKTRPGTMKTFGFLRKPSPDWAYVQTIAKEVGSCFTKKQLLKFCTEHPRFSQLLEKYQIYGNPAYPLSEEWNTSGMLVLRTLDQNALSSWSALVSVHSLDLIQPIIQLDRFRIISYKPILFSQNVQLIYAKKLKVWSLENELYFHVFFTQTYQSTEPKFRPNENNLTNIHDVLTHFKQHENLNVNRS